MPAGFSFIILLLTRSVSKLAAPNACNASSVTGPIRAIRFYSQMEELQPLQVEHKAENSKGIDRCVPPKEDHRTRN